MIDLQLCHLPVDKNWSSSWNFAFISRSIHVWTSGWWIHITHANSQCQHLELMALNSPDIYIYTYMYIKKMNERYVSLHICIHMQAPGSGDLESECIPRSWESSWPKDANWPIISHHFRQSGLFKIQSNVNAHFTKTKNRNINLTKMNTPIICSIKNCNPCNHQAKLDTSPSPDSLSAPWASSTEKLTCQIFGVIFWRLRGSHLWRCWDDPNPKYMSQIGSFPQGSGWFFFTTELWNSKLC